MNSARPYQYAALIVPRVRAAPELPATNSLRLVLFSLRRGIARPDVARHLLLVTISMSMTAVILIAQPLRQPDKLQIGLGALPGVGMQLGYVDAGPAFTREALAYAQLSPRFRSGREALHVSAGLGAAVRIVGLLETLTLITPRAWDVHVGFRFGPGLNFSADETRGAKNQRFSLFLEPFVRFMTAPRGNQVYFFEAGIHQPALRAGIWLNI